MMQKVLSIISLILMSAIMSLAIAGIDPDLMFDIALAMFVVLMAKKGVERMSVRDVFNMRKQKISLNGITSIVELLLSVEFVIICSVPNTSVIEYGNLSNAVNDTVVSVLMILAPLVFFYRVFFMNIFNEDKIDKEKLERLKMRFHR
jgi:acetyl-CoA acetyltransferase